MSETIATRLAACAAMVLLLAQPVVLLGDMPLMNGIEEARAVGPRTEQVNLDAYQQVLYVSAAAPADGADGSREKPFATPAAALDAVKGAGESSRCAILVGAGTYRGANLAMKEFVDLYGGFDAQWNRDVLQQPTILDAEKAGPVLRGANNATLDGFVITNGQSNAAGGAIVCEHASPTISNNVIRGNSTTPPADFRLDMIHQRGTDGGAIAATYDASPVIRNNLICENTTGIGNGGGIWVWNHCSPKIFSNVIAGNHTGLAGRGHKEGSRSSNGGGIAVSFDCAPVIAGNVIVLNTSVDNSDGGGIYLEYDADAQIRGNWFAGNFGQDDGGGMYVMKNSEPVVERNVFAGNRNTSGGSGGIRLSKDGRLRARNNLFIDNPDNAIDAVSSWMVLENNTFADSGHYGLIFENVSPYYSASQIAGNIYSGRMTEPMLIKPGVPHPPIVRNNLSPTVLPGEGNIAGTPTFIEDAVEVERVSGSFDPVSYVTTFRGAVVGGENNALAGRIANIGDRWSVIKSSDTQSVTVWGDVAATADGAAPLRILGTYQLAENSPVGQGLGAYATPPQAAGARP